MQTINLDNMHLASLSHLDMVEVNGGDAAYDEGYNLGRAIGTGVRRGLAIISVWMMFL